MNLIETESLSLREFSTDDTDFIIELLNDPDFIRNIADRGVRTTADACAYIENRLIASYHKFGFGLYRVTLKASGEPIGMCGLVKRDGLEDVDIGFAFLPAFRGKGYAYEAAAAVMEYARDTLGLTRIVGITLPDNHGSIRVLEKLGMRFEKLIKLPGDDEEIKLFTFPS
jgi:RimJ/RimL family protein N-acetyltransferase